MNKSTPAITMAFLIAIALLETPVFGQMQEQSSNINRFRADAISARTMRRTMSTISIPGGVQLPPIKDAAIIVVGGTNGDPNRTVTLAVNNPQGWYYVQGALSGDDNMLPLGSWNFTGPIVGTVTVPIINGNVSQVLPGLDMVWRVDVIHLGGALETLSAICGPYEDQSANVNVQVTGDQNINGLYSVSLKGETADITSVAVGQYGLTSDIRQAPTSSTTLTDGGVTAVFAPYFSPQTGPTTITVCRITGWCSTDTYKPKASGGSTSPGKG